MKIFVKLQDTKIQLSLQLFDITNETIIFNRSKQNELLILYICCYGNKKISEVKLNPNNPRIIKDDKFKNWFSLLKTSQKCLILDLL